MYLFLVERDGMEAGGLRDFRVEMYLVLQEIMQRYILDLCTAFSGSEQVALPAFEFEFLPCFHHGLQHPFLYYITLYQQAEEKSLGTFSSNFSALRCRKAAVFILMLDISDGSREEISNKCDKIGSTETGMGWTST
ncbi:unnamed protein product [Musa hybrid cultivar]